MSYRLPLDAEYLILNYISIYRLIKLKLDKYFWINYLQANLPIPYSTETLNQLITRYKIVDIIQLAAYFNYVLPVIEKYLSPVQCYMALVDVQDEASVLIRRYYIPLIYPYLNNSLYKLFEIIAYKSLSNRTLVDDYIKLYSYVTENSDSEEPISLYYILAGEHTVQQLADIRNIAEKLRVDLDDEIKYYTTAVNIVRQQPLTVNDLQPHPYLYTLLAQYGYDDIIEELNLSYSDDKMLLIEGYLLGNRIDKALALLKTTEINEDFDFAVFNYVDSLPFYQEMEKIWLSRGFDDTIYFKALMECVSLHNNDNVLSESKIFSYALSKMDFTFTHLPSYNTAYDLLDEKSLFDFHGFVLIWERLPAKYRKIGPEFLAANEAKSIALNIPKFL